MCARLSVNACGHPSARSRRPRGDARSGRRRFGDLAVEPLERRATPANLALAGGVLTLTAAPGEANNLTVEIVGPATARQVRIADAGPGVTIQPTGAGLVVESARAVRAPVASVAAVRIRTGDGADAITLKLNDALPADIRVVGDDAASTDRVRVVGTGGDDVINLAVRELPGDIDDLNPNPEDGAKATRLTRKGRSIDFVGYEDLTLDLAGAGRDVVTVDRAISGLDRPVRLTLLGGGNGTDTLAVTAAGNVPQTVDITNGSLTIGDNLGGSELFLGRSDNISIDQPRVVIEVIDFRPVSTRILDDRDPGFAMTGTWRSATAAGRTQRLNDKGSGADAATWTFTAREGHSYRISATWQPRADLASDSPFTIIGGNSAPKSVRVNQRVAPTGPGGWQVLGVVDTEFAFQSQIQVRLSDAANGTVAAAAIRVEEFDATSLGPSFFSTFLLDTGATGIVVAGEAVSELEPLGYQTYPIKYLEQGVAGFTPMDVSRPYRVDFAGDSGERNTLLDFQILSSPDLSFSFLGPWGIAGMPTMVGRVTTMDWSGWSRIFDPGDPFDPFNPFDPLDSFQSFNIKTDFRSDLPPDSGHQYRVPLRLVDFPDSGRQPGGPSPTFAPLPYIPVKVRDDGREVQGEYLLDTGAQLSIIATSTARALGLDRNGDGVIAGPDETVGSLPVGGIGGMVNMPLVTIDRLAVPTEDGTDLVWTNLLAGVVDIEVEGGPALAGVFGMDFLTSGWATKVLGALSGQVDPNTPDGYFQKVHLDFRDAANRRGTLVFDVTPEHDRPVAPRTNALPVVYSGIDRLSVTTGTGDDIYRVAPSTTMPMTLDGGAHTTGDTLQVVVPAGTRATNDRAAVRIPGYQPISYTRFEKLNVPVSAASSTQIIDDGDAGFSTSGNWLPWSKEGRGDDIRYSAAGTGADVATWTFTVTPGRTYRVAATWHPLGNRATDSPYELYDGSTWVDTVRVNQQLAPNDFTDAGSAWETLGTITASGSTLQVKLSDDANRYVIADAIRIEEVPATAGNFRASGLAVPDAGSAGGAGRLVDQGGSDGIVSLAMPLLTSTGVPIAPAWSRLRPLLTALRAGGVAWPTTDLTASAPAVDRLLPSLIDQIRTWMRP